MQLRNRKPPTETWTCLSGLEETSPKWWLNHSGTTPGKQWKTKNTASQAGKGAEQCGMKEHWKTTVSWRQTKSSDPRHQERSKVVWRQVEDKWGPGGRQVEDLPPSQGTKRQENEQGTKRETTANKTPSVPKH